MDLGQDNMPYLSVIQFIMYLLDIYNCLLPIFYLLVFYILYDICCILAAKQIGV
jgi:hypothetical protein